MERISEKSYSITIGIPTKNRAEKIPNCLRALENQTFRDFNVIVVDGSKGDETRDICLKFSKKMDITYIKSLKPGISRARKIISEKCQSELLLLFDDDVYLRNNCISKLFEHYIHQKNRDKCVISGQIKYYGNLSTPMKLTRQGVGFPVSASDADYFISTLVLIPKNVYKRISWTERFVSWGFEEVLFFLVCKRHGVKLSWVNSVLAVHDDNQRSQRIPVGIETNRAYTMLYKHVFVEPSIINVLTLESVGFIQFLIANTIGHLFSPKKLVVYVISYIYAWKRGHFWFLKDLSCLKRPK